ARGCIRGRHPGARRRHPMDFLTTRAGRVRPGREGRAPNDGACGPDARAMDEIVTLPAVDGVHDLGGMHGFGAVPIETGEPIFHALWEGRVWALLGAVMPATTIDRFRWTIEQMPPAEYLNSAYYARWLWAIERLANEQGLLTGSAAPARIARPEPSSRPASARWQRGQRVRVLSRVSAG